MTDILLRVALFSGLAIHKVVWEVMKRPSQSRAPVTKRPRVSLPLRLVKLAKIGVLGFLLVQTLFLDVLPINDGNVLRLTGLALFLAGLATAVTGRVQLGSNWSDIENPSVDAGHQVVSTGIYRYIRHPIYAGDLIMLTGLELSLNSWLVLGVVPLALAIISRVAAEEGQLLRTQAGYGDYQNRTKRFIPFIV